jgi:hypothetical protein
MSDQQTAPTINPYDPKATAWEVGKRVLPVGLAAGGVLGLLGGMITARPGNRIRKGLKWGLGGGLLGGLLAGGAGGYTGYRAGNENRTRAMSLLAADSDHARDAAGAGGDSASMDPEDANALYNSIDRAAESAQIPSNERDMLRKLLAPSPVTSPRDSAAITRHLWSSADNIRRLDEYRKTMFDEWAGKQMDKEKIPMDDFLKSNLGTGYSLNNLVVKSHAEAGAKPSGSFMDGLVSNRSRIPGWGS